MFVYIITNLVNGKTYVGKTYNAKKRWQKHKTWARSETPPPGMVLYRAMKCHGISSFKFEVVARGLSKEDAHSVEQSLIQKLASLTTQSGYNVLPGGGGNHRSPSLETRAKISSALKGRPLAPRARAHVLAAIKRRGPEVYAKVREKLKGRPRPDHLRETMARNNRVGAATMHKRGQETRGRVRQLWEQGQSSREIASSLGLGVSTVEGHVRALKGLAFTNN